jgi:hypothetical protein
MTNLAQLARADLIIINGFNLGVLGHSNGLT